ncbi:MAG: response regulator transcription factor [Pseudomonadota bacterium]
MTPRLLLVDDDEVFCRVLSAALAKRGYAVSVAHDVEQGKRLAEHCTPQYAVVDLNMPGPSGLVLIAHLKALDARIKTIVLTGYASVATAVEAIKLGAVHYLAKPVDADEIIAAFRREEGDSAAPVAAQPLSVQRLEWEHLQKVLHDCDGNISAAARRLNMHRRTLQRKLKKRPARQ